VVTALMKVDGISDVTVDVKKSTASVTYDPAKTGPEKLVAAFKDTKFSASKAEDPDKSDKNKKGS